MDDSLSARQVIAKVVGRLTGNDQQDLQMLMQAGQAYASHPDAKAILLQIGRLLADRMPPDAKAEIMGAIDQSGAGAFQSEVEKAEQLIRAGEMKRARIALADILKKYGGIGMELEDALAEYRCLNNEFEDALYFDIFRPQKPVRQMPYNLAHVWFRFGFVLLELGQLDHAEQALGQAHIANPIRADYQFEQAEVFKRHGDLNKVRELTMRAMYVSATEPDMARGYRNLGFVAIERRQWSHAADLYFFSLAWDDSALPVVENQLMYIAAKSGKEPNVRTAQEIERDLAKLGIPVRPSDAVQRVLAELDQ